MLKSFFMLVALLAFTAAPPRDKPTAGDKAAGPGGKTVPEFKAIKWYNTAPITLEDLKGKAVLLQVFRTW